MTIKALFIGDYDTAMHNVRPEAEMIIGLARRGYDIEVMTVGSCEYAKRMASFGIRIHDYLPRRKFSWDAVRRVRRVLREGGHQVMQLFNNKAIVAGNFASIGLPVKVVTYRGQTGNISRRDPTCYLTHLHPSVDRIVCVAEAVRQSLLPHVTDPRKLVTIYKGHDLAWYGQPAPVDRASLGVPADAVMVTTIANYRPRKGIEVLVEAGAHLDPGLPVHFVVVGSGMDSPELARRVAASPLADRFHLFGYRDDVLNIVAASDATVLPSTKREGLPRTVIESMALGIPAIATATGGSPELVVDGDSGVVIPPGAPAAIAAAVAALAGDPALRERMGARGRERIATAFNVEQSIDAHAALFEELAAGG